MCVVSTRIFKKNEAISLFVNVTILHDIKKGHKVKGNQEEGDENVRRM